MVQKMLKFVNTPQAMPPKRAAETRVEDFNEVYQRYDIDKAAEQASRCSQCGIPYCQIHCPVQNNIPDWLKLTAEGRIEEAYELSSATNNFPEICGRICPQDRLCEGNCVIEKDYESVTIGSVEKFITDTAWEKGWVTPFTPARELNQSVGIIGSGPGGMAAAEQLRRKGYKVEIYERQDRVGGLMIYGIPGFKLEKEIVLRRHKQYEDSGIVFHTNFDVGHDASLADLRAKHDAVLIATGVYKARDIKLPGSGLENIQPALTYLIASNRHGLGDTVGAYDDGSLNAYGKNVVVIGGGDTAMDCVRTAVRQGAKSVKCLYRRDRENMPGSMREVKNAEEEGVEFVWLAAPQAFLARGKDKAVKAVRATCMRLGTPDATGRQSPEPIEGSDFTLEADLVIKALGFDPEDLPIMFNAPELDVTRWGTVKVDYKSSMTNLDGVFAVGDIVRGASLVVWAIHDGREAARSMESHLKAQIKKPVATEVAHTKIDSGHDIAQAS